MGFNELVYLKHIELCLTRRKLLLLVLLFLFLILGKSW